MNRPYLNAAIIAGMVAAGLLVAVLLPAQRSAPAPTNRVAREDIETDLCDVNALYPYNDLAADGTVYVPGSEPVRVRVTFTMHSRRVASSATTVQALHGWTPWDVTAAPVYPFGTPVACTVTAVKEMAPRPVRAAQLKEKR